MFYAHFVLAKKGPLARIWLAAHWDKKLTKAHVFETNIEDSVKGIIQPKVKMALRTSGHLLLGVVRIYSRKAKYLLADCNEAFVKIKMAFRPGMVDLPEDNREAAMNAITLPEVFHDFDTAMPDMGEVDIQASFKTNQTRAEEITMREDYGNINLDRGVDDGFGEQIGSPEMLREPTEPDFGAENVSLHQGTFSHVPSTYGDQQSLLLGQSYSMILGEQSVAGSAFDGPSRAESLAPSRAESVPPSIAESTPPSRAGSIRPPSPTESTRSSRRLNLDAPIQDRRLNLDAPIQDDGFGGSMASTGQDILAGGLFEDGSLFDDTPASMPPSERGAPSEYHDDGDHFGGPPSPGVSSGGSRPASPARSPSPPTSPTPSHRSITSHRSHISQASTAKSTRNEIVTPVIEEGQTTPEPETTTLIQNEEESFALAPVEASAIKGLTRTKRKRKLIVDEIKAISGEEMKGQLSDTGDIVTTLDLAPPTKRLMHWKETGGVEKLFALPGRLLQARHIHDDYAANLIVRNSDQNETFELLGDDAGEPDLNLEQVKGASEFQEPLVPPPKKEPRGRKRKNAAEDGESEMSEYQKRQAELAAAVEEDARMEREKDIERARERSSPVPEEEATVMTPRTPFNEDRDQSEERSPVMNTPYQEGTPYQNQASTPYQEPNSTPYHEPDSTPYHDPNTTPYHQPQSTPADSLTEPPRPFPNETPGQDSYYRGPEATPAFSGYDGQTPAYPDEEDGTPAYSQLPGPLYPPTASPLPNQESGPPDSAFPTPDHGITTPHLENEHRGVQGLPVGPQHDFTDQWVSQAANATATGDALPPPRTPAHETDWEEHRPASNCGRVTPEEELEEEEEEDDNEGDNEYLDEETVDEFEDRVLNKRAAQLHVRLRRRMVEASAEIPFSTITKKKDSRKIAAQKFYSLLVLQKFMAVDLGQDNVSYGEMIVKRGPQFNLDTAKV